MNTRSEQSGEDLWVFGYGSLMWRPGFDFLERRHARLVGAHRALCVYSFVHRGTPERPGLVLGLDRGGNCRGIAYRVAAAKARRDDRLSARRASRSRWSIARPVAPVWLDDDPQQSVRALCYMVDRGHRQYAGRLPLDRAIAFRPPGPWPLRQQPRLRAGGGQGDRGAGLSRRRAANAGRAAQGHARRHCGVSR